MTLSAWPPRDMHGARGSRASHDLEHRLDPSFGLVAWLFPGSNGESPELRQKCQAGLNKSEQRHALAQVWRSPRSSTGIRPTWPMPSTGIPPILLHDNGQCSRRAAVAPDDWKRRFAAEGALDHRQDMTADENRADCRVDGKSASCDLASIFMLTPE